MTELLHLTCNACGAGYTLTKENELKCTYQAYAVETIPFPLTRGYSSNTMSNKDDVQTIVVCGNCCEKFDSTYLTEYNPDEDDS